mmetsp:Transcript_4272/g.8382  ORF Transcript_4272/g.8382 Transcript_4272/m.8382 type:complete len:513 (-) Transcript_4272:1925-3463(-)
MRQVLSGWTRRADAESVAPDWSGPLAQGAFAHDAAVSSFRHVPGRILRKAGAGYLWRTLSETGDASEGVSGSIDVGAAEPQTPPLPMRSSADLAGAVYQHKTPEQVIREAALAHETNVDQAAMDEAQRQPLLPSPQAPQYPSVSPQPEGELSTLGGNVRGVLLPEPSTSEVRLHRELCQRNIHVDKVRKLAWAGVPARLRAMVWKLLLGYLPSSSARRDDTLGRKRRAYLEAVDSHYSTNMHRSEDEEAIHRQVVVDVPRTCPCHAFFHVPEVQTALTRVLYIWAVRHPATSYVQGMNDLATPFFFVFFMEQLATVDRSARTWSSEEVLALHSLQDVFLHVPSEVQAAALDAVEADAYWCLTALLDKIHDYYTFAQPGIQKRVFFMQELVSRVDADLKHHLDDEGLDFMQFAFRWMNCLLMRELPFPLMIRVWDAYVSEPDGFAVFHVYVCAALLHSFSAQLRKLDFQDLIMFLQNLPTQQWTLQEIDLILSQAFLWNSIFGSSGHLTQRIQ